MVFQDSTNLNSISKYIVDIGGGTPYITIQSALDAANAEVVSGAVSAAAVYVRPGVYTEDLICYGKVDLLATQTQTDSYITEIVGTHTPPLTGYSGWYGFTLTGTTAVWRSNAAGTARLGQWNTITRLTGDGYTYDIPNWAGEVNLWGFLDDITIGNVNGWINNQFGSAEVNIIFAGVGLTPTTGTMLINGSLVLQGMLVGTKIRLLGNATAQINMGCELLNTIELRDNSTVDIQNSYFSTGIEEAINTTSTLPVTLGNVCIDSTADPVINGTGTIQMSSVSFLNRNTIAGTITQDRTGAFSTGIARTAVIEAVGAGAGAQNVVDITPNTAIGGVAWAGVFIDGAALDPTAANSVVHAFECDLSGVDTTNDPDLVGAHITMPAVVSEGCDAAIRSDGYGITSLSVCSEREAGLFTDGTIEQEQDITGFVALDTGASIPVTIDSTGATGGDFHVLDVTVTGAGTAAVVAVSTNPEVEVIHQHTGVFAATAQSWKFNGGYTDVTAAFDNPAVDVTIFDGDDDYIYIGANAAFSQIRVILETVAGRNIRPIFEYSTVGPVWVPFNPSDGTNGFLQNGIIEFDSANLAAWAAVVVNGANHFYIRIQRTRNNIVTIPIEDTIRILEPVEYSWNEDGDILAASVTAAGLADTSGTQYEILTFGAGGILNGIGPLTDGQLIIGDTAATAVAATLASADGSVTITNGAGTIDLAAAIGLTWSVEAGAGVAAAVNSGYIANRAGGVTFTIPTTAAVGSIIRICSIQGLWTIAQNAAESIVFGAFTTTVGVGGSLVATNVGDTIEIVCTVADTTWAVLSSIGNITVN